MKAGAQIAAPTLLEPEARADLIVGHLPTAQLGVGVQLPLGYYVRVGLDIAAGVRIGAFPNAQSSATARVDLLTRFLLDPFRQSAYGLSVGGGISARAEPGDRVRPFLLAAMELEGRRRMNGWSPALQVGLGGGTRVGIIARRSATPAVR